MRYLSNNWSKFEASIVETSKEKYLVEMAKAGTYGGEPEIQALCMLHNRRCLIYLGGLGCPVQTREYGVPLAESDGDVELIYISDECYDNGHYDLAVKDLIKVAQMEAIYALWREAKIKDMPKTFFKEDNQNYGEQWRPLLLIAISNAGAGFLVNGSAAFKWKLCCHWLKGQQQCQVIVLIQGPRKFWIEQGSFWVWIQPMRDIVTLWRHLSLAEPISRIIQIEDLYNANIRYIGHR